MRRFSVLLEQFIRAKYEREEFVDANRQAGYMASAKSGHLFKRGRDNAKFEIRRFELSEASNTLAYYVKEVRLVPPPPPPPGDRPPLAAPVTWYNSA